MAETTLVGVPSPAAGAAHLLAALALADGVTAAVVVALPAPPVRLAVVCGVEHPALAAAVRAAGGQLWQIGPAAPAGGCDAFLASDDPATVETLYRQMRFTCAGRTG